MNPLGSHDPMVSFAFWLGVTVVVVTLLMLLLIIAMRWLVTRHEAAYRRAVARWKELLAGTPPELLPALPRAELEGFVNAWVGHARQEDARLPYLRRCVRELELEDELLAMLQRPDFNGKVAAITVLGYLGELRHFDLVASFLEDRSPILSLCAASALMRLDPARAVRLFVPQIIRREDWSRGRVAAILEDAGEPSVARVLSEATLRANAALASRLVRFLAGVSPQEASPVIRSILATEEDDHLFSTCLQVMDNPADLDLVRPLLSHERWHVRMHAASALGRLGTAADAADLASLLSDPQWWVRYRAAQALSRLPFPAGGGLEAMGKDLTDRFAIDILGQVLAEKRLGMLA